MHYYGDRQYVTGCNEVMWPPGGVSIQAYDTLTYCDVCFASETSLVVHRGVQTITSNKYALPDSQHMEPVCD